VTSRSPEKTVEHRLRALTRRREWLKNRIAASKDRASMSFDRAEFTALNFAIHLIETHPDAAAEAAMDLKRTKSA
jgi:hypothetical protein